MNGKDIDFGQATQGAKALAGEYRESVFAALLVGVGLGTAIFYNLGIYTLADSGTLLAVTMGTVLFGIIELPRLEEVSVFMRLFLMMIITSTQAITLLTLLGDDFQLAAAIALVGLFTASMVNFTAQAGIGLSDLRPSRDVEPGTIRMHGASFGLALATIAATLLGL